MVGLLFIIVMCDLTNTDDVSVTALISRGHIITSEMIISETNPFMISDRHYPSHQILQYLNMII